MRASAAPKGNRMLTRLIAKVFRNKPSLIRVPDGHKLFRCLARGENFPGGILASPNPIGFYATRYVAAESPAAAEMLALGILRNDASLQLPSGVEKSPDARVFFESIEEVPSDTPPVPNKGFSFYEMGT
jgi:hypothetical protein